MVWYGMVQYYMVWYGIVLYGKAWYCMVKHGMVWYGMVEYGTVWYGLVWYCIVLYGKVWQSMVGYGMVWHGMVLYGMLWHSTVWYVRKHVNNNTVDLLFLTSIQPLVLQIKETMVVMKSADKTKLRTNILVCTIKSQGQKVYIVTRWKSILF